MTPTLQPPERQGGAIKSALVVGSSAIVGALIPLAPFIFIPVGISMVISVAVAALTLFVVGLWFKVPVAP